MVDEWFGVVFKWVRLFVQLGLLLSFLVVFLLLTAAVHGGLIGVMENVTGTVVPSVDVGSRMPLETGITESMGVLRWALFAGLLLAMLAGALYIARR